MDLNALALFAKVVKANSFSEAARQLNMPIATVSRRVAELENQLGICLLRRSTRHLCLTDVGSEVLEHAQRTVDLREAVAGIVSNHKAVVSGTLRVCAPPTIDALLPPLLCAFQSSYPQVRVHVCVTANMQDYLEADVDVAFRLGPLKDSSLVARRILSYRHRLVASRDYVAKHQPPERPRDLLDHPLVTFSQVPGENVWGFINSEDGAEETLTFVPHLSMNAFSSLTPALLAGAGVGDLPPLVQPQLLKSGDLVEVMPRWRFRALDLSLLHLGGPYVPRTVRLFKEFAAQFAPTLVPAPST
jgi:DNA-binding transcriptional LysR family regulator